MCSYPTTGVSNAERPERMELLGAPSCIVILLTEENGEKIKARQEVVMLKSGDFLYAVERRRPKAKKITPSCNLGPAILFGIVVIVVSLVSFLLGWHPNWHRLVEFLAPSY